MRTARGCGAPSTAIFAAYPHVANVVSRKIASKCPILALPVDGSGRAQDGKESNAAADGTEHDDDVS